MNILCITHADFEGPGIIQDWAKEKGFGFRVVKPYLGQDCVSETDFDLLLLMGGPQSALNLEDYSYLVDEIALIQKAFFGRKSILGFCLGAQLISVALGAEAEKSPFPEIGMLPITLNKKAKEDPCLFDWPETLSVAHWHSDMPGLTEEGVVLAESEGCPRQILRFDPKIYGFQCHPELHHRSLKDLVKHCGDDLKKKGRYIQDKAFILSADTDEMNACLRRFLDRFIAL